MANFVGLASGTKEYTDPETGEKTTGQVLRRADLPPRDRRLHDPGRLPAGHRAPADRATRSATSSIPIWPSTSPTCWPWPTPVRAPTVRSSSSPSGRTPHLNRKHTIFGEVADQSSRDVVDEIAQVRTGRGDRPADPVVITSVDIARVTHPSDSNPGRRPGLLAAGFRPLLPPSGAEDRHLLPAVPAADLRRVHEPGLGRLPVSQVRRRPGGQRVRAPRTAFGAVLRPGGGNATKVVMGSPRCRCGCSTWSAAGWLDRLLVMSNEAVYVGQFWRLVTAALTPAVSRRADEPAGALARRSGPGVRAGQLADGRAVPRRRPGRHHAVLRVRPVRVRGYGASAAVIGLLAANAIFKHKTREDVRADIGLFVLLILYSVLVGFRSFGWLMLIGGIVVGALVGVVLAYAPRQNRSHGAGGRPAGSGLVCVLAVAVKLTSSEGPDAARPRPRVGLVSASVGCRGTSQPTGRTQLQDRVLSRRGRQCESRC